MIFFSHECERKQEILLEFFLHHIENYFILFQLFIESFHSTIHVMLDKTIKMVYYSEIVRNLLLPMVLFLIAYSCV